MKIDLHDVHGLTDPCLLPALKLYEQAFPLYEQMTTSFWIENLRDMPGKARHFLAAIDRENDEVVGMAFYEICRSAPALAVARLWYLCTREERRGQGLGSRMYGILISRLFAEGVRAVAFEVERPDAAIDHGDDQAELAARRIQWYRRNGAMLLQNVDYLQYVDNGLPPTPMYLMIHPQAPLSGEEAFRLVTEVLGLKAEAVGPLVLE